MNENGNENGNVVKNFLADLVFPKKEELNKKQYLQNFKLLPPFTTHQKSFVHWGVHGFCVSSVGTFKSAAQKKNFRKVFPLV